MQIPNWFNLIDLTFNSKYPVPKKTSVSLLDTLLFAIVKNIDLIHIWLDSIRGCSIQK